MESERDKLIRELNILRANDNYAPLHKCLLPQTIECISNFIISDRKKIVEPLVKLIQTIPTNLRTIEAIRETLRNAGIE